MEYLLVVYFLMSGVWVRGDELEGWGSISYPTEAICLERKARAEEIQVDLKRINPRAIPKRYTCEPHETDPGGNG
ncbi:MAG: hypothetical protein ACTSQ7_10220 [Alphaproteobacteria bacterium]